MIQINSKTEVNFEDSGRLIPILCDVKAVNPENIILACPKQAKELALKLRPGMHIELNVYSMNGVIVMTSIIKNASNPDFIVIEYPKEKKRLQRREFFRVNIQRPCEVYYFDVQKEYFHKGKTIDLSGGGVRFWTPDSIKVGYTARIDMFIGDYCETREPVRAEGRILYTKTHDSLFTTKPGYISVIQFQNISTRSLKLIMKACFKIQIDMRQKGVL